MSRELWAVERCEHGFPCTRIYPNCPGREPKPLDFDAIWDRYYEASDRRNMPGLTYDGLRWIVFGEDGE